jgi:S-(hydroxymethyl)glutathione dehydrogenase/alcohol dehydrogenase
MCRRQGAARHAWPFERQGGGTATIIGMVPYGVRIELHGFDFLRDRKIQGTSMGGNRFRVDMPRLLSLWR